MSRSIIGTEYLPNAHIEKITYQSFPSYNRAVVTVAVYDSVGLTWSKYEEFVKYFQLSCFVVTRHRLIQQLNLGEVTFDSIGNDYDTHSIHSGYNSLSQTKVMLKGTMYRKFTQIFTFEIPRDILNLTVYAFSKIDLKTLREKEGLELSFAENLSYMGAVEAEIVIRNKDIIENAIVFRDAETGEPWSGPVHFHPPAGYMEGSFHSARPHRKLLAQTIPNEKLVIPGGQSFVESTLFTDNDAQLPEKTQKPPPPFISEYYQLEYVEDEDRNVNNIIILEMGNALLKSSRQAKLIFERDPDLLAKISETVDIKNISFERYPVVKSFFVSPFGLNLSMPDLSAPTSIAKSNNNSSVVKTKILYKTSPRENISVDPNMIQKIKNNTVFDGKKISPDVVKAAKKIGRVQQIDLSMPSNFRPVNLTDYSIKDIESGEFKYKLMYSLKNTPLEYCQNILKDMLSYSKKISGFLDALILKNVFNGTHFDIDFLADFYSQYNIEIDREDGAVLSTFETEAMLDSFLVKSYTTLAEVEKLLGLSFSYQYLNALNLYATDLDKIADFSSHYKYIIQRFMEEYDLNIEQSFEKSSAGNAKNKQYIEASILLPEIYEKKQFAPIGLSYVVPGHILDEVPRINFGAFLSRTNKEVNKFFAKNISGLEANLENIPNNAKEGFLDIESQRYVNFSPVNFNFSGQQIDTSEINPVSFDTDFFNNVRTTRAALESFESVQASDDVAEPETEEDIFVDSRDYLSTETKFNTTILRTLTRNPFGVTRVRKQFKYLDNKILKANNSKLSLDVFDISKPKSLLLKETAETFKNVPLQIKALSLLKTPVTNFDLASINYDPLSNPQTQEVFEQNYLNIGKVEYLSGFEKKHGLIVMNEPIYKQIDSKNLTELKRQKTLCRIVQTSYSGFFANTNTFNVFDKIFIFENEKDPQPETSTPIDEETETETYLNDFIDIEKTDYTSQIVRQNPSNSSVLSAVPLETLETVIMEDVEVSTASPASPSTSGGSVY